MPNQPGPESIWLELLGATVRFVDAGGVRTRVVEAGEGPALIFLHGAGGHAEAFAPNVLPLARRGMRVIAIDYLGHGLTERPDQAVGRDDYVTHLVNTMDALGIESATLAGESLGGWVAIWTALMHPERVEKLISVCGARLEIERDPDSQAHVDAGRQRFLALNQAFLDDPSPDTVRNRLAWLFHEPERAITDELVQVRWALYQHAQAAKTLQSISTSGVAGGGTEEADFDEGILRTIRHETLMLWTSHNPSNTAATARRAASFIPDCRFVLMEDCGHWPQWEDPDTFNQLVGDFTLGDAEVGEVVSVV